ncbi:MAG TPA: hypothetical protein VK184_07425 [Nostocaceae cyanobacterium]|nr:hypothetical protein [Nostocaceae cyanobacterium]
MTQTPENKNIDLRYLIDNFGIQLVIEPQFFPEWQEDLPEITDLEKQLLDKVKAGYINLLNYPPLLEDVVIPFYFNNDTNTGGGFITAKPLQAIH